MQQSIAVRNIVPGRNPRTFFDPAEMAELEQSVQSKGVIQPILLRPVGEKYEIVAGERRWRAASKVHGENYEIPALIREMTDEEADEAALIENVQRANMSPTEEAEAAAKVLGRCNGDRDEAARRLGWSRQVIDKRLALMNCSESVRKALTERKIQLGHAELLAASTKEKQDSGLATILALPALPTVAALKAMLNQVARALTAAIFDQQDCTSCPHNSGNQRALFAEAIDAGNCTNGDCYERKTEAALDAKRVSMADEFPVVRIVRPGENFTLLKLVADGPTGVGSEQASACRACQNFGAAISAVPGKVGNTYKDLCFDANCNAGMVAARIKKEQASAKEKAAPAKKGGVSAASKPKAASSSPDAEKPKVAVQDSNRVKEFRVKVWREILRNELYADPAKNLVALIAIGMTGNARHVESSKMSQAFEKLSGNKVNSSTDLKLTAEQIAASGEECITTLHRGLVATVAAGIEERHVVQLLNWLGTDIGKHWKLSDEYLQLLTKSEIEVIADEIGLTAAVGKDYSKLMTGKKDEIIKALLKVEGFDYSGKVPANMRWPNA